MDCRVRCPEHRHHTRDVMSHSSSGDDEAERSPEQSPNSNGSSGSASTSLWQQLEELRIAWVSWSDASVTLIIALNCIHVHHVHSNGVTLCRDSSLPACSVVLRFEVPHVVKVEVHPLIVICISTASFEPVQGQFGFNLSPWDWLGKPLSMGWLAVLAYVTYQTTVGTLSFNMSHSCIKVVVNVGTFVTKCGIK